MGNKLPLSEKKERGWGKEDMTAPGDGRGEGWLQLGGRAHPEPSPRGRNEHGWQTESGPMRRSGSREGRAKGPGEQKGKGAKKDCHSQTGWVM